MWAALQTMTHGCELVPCGLTQELKGITKYCTAPRVQPHLNNVCAVKIKGKKGFNRRPLTEAKPVFAAGVLIRHGGKSTDVTNDNNGTEPEQYQTPTPEQLNRIQPLVIIYVIIYTCAVSRFCPFSGWD